MKTIKSITSIVAALFLISVSSSAQDSYEPNNSFVQATPIENGHTYSASICQSGDTDYYKISTSKAGLYSLEVENISPNIDINIEIIDNDEITVLSASNSSSEGQKVVLDHNSCGLSDFVYIKVNDGIQGQENGFDCEIEYLLNIEMTVFEDYTEGECNNSFDQAKEIYKNDSIVGLISPFNDKFTGIDKDRDFFKYKLESAGVLSLHVLNVPAEIDLDIRIYNPDQDSIIIFKLDSDPGAGYSLEFSTCFSEEFIFIVLEDGTELGENAFSINETYQFSLDFQAFSEYDQFEGECNNSFTEAEEIFALDTIRGFISPIFDSNLPPTQDQDYYKIQFESPGFVSINLTQVPKEIDLNIKVFGPDQKTLILNEHSAEEGVGYSAHFSICEQNKYYYIALFDGNDDGDSEYSTSESYEFDIDFTSFTQLGLTEDECNNNSSTAKSIAFGDTITALLGPHFDITSFSEEDNFRLDLVNDGLYEFNFIDSQEGLIFYFLDKTGSSISTGFSGPNEGFQVFFHNCDHIDTIYFSVFLAYNEYSIDDTYQFVVHEYLYSDIDSLECADSFSDPKTIELCDTTFAFIGPTDLTGSKVDKDIYQITLDSNKIYDIYVNFDQTSLDLLKLNIYHSDDLNEALISYEGSQILQINKTFQPPSTGEYHFVISSNSNNIDLFNSYSFVIGCSIATGIEEQENSIDLKIYPNPATNEIHLRNSEHKHSDISFYSITGLPYYAEQIGVGHYDISTFPAGIYLVKTTINGQTLTDKLIKL